VLLAAALEKKKETKRKRVVENRRSTDAENERKQCIVLLGRRGL
jgi:hypothetical protein